MSANTETDVVNPDDLFVLQGVKSPIRRNSAEYLTNSQKTISSKNLSTSLGASGANKNLSIEELGQSLEEIQLEVNKLNSSLLENAGKSRIYLTEDVHDTQNDGDKTNILSSKEEDPELTALIQRTDNEAVGHVETDGSEWFKDPKHLTKGLGEYPTLQSLGVSNRSVSPVNRSVGRVGAEIMTKELDGKLTSLDLSANESTFPIRLTAPHIVGVRSLLPPQYPVRSQSPERAKSLSARLGESTVIRPRSAASASQIITRDRSPSPRPIWMPVDPHANASSLSPPAWKKRSRGRKRTQSARTTRKKQQQHSLSHALCVKPYNPDKYTRPTVQSSPSGVELSFLKSADSIDTRRCLVNNSPYQQELARLRLQRLRVEEEYMLQLKREAELERIRGPKPKWYEMTGPEFHYECNKNTAVHKNVDKWEDTIQYRDELQQVSREFTANMKGPVPNLA